MTKHIVLKHLIKTDKCGLKPTIKCLHNTKEISSMHIETTI